MTERVLSVREPFITAFPGTTAEAHAAGVLTVAHAKQGMAQVVTADSIMPCLRLDRQVLKPRAASLTNFTFMVQVQAPGGGTCIGQTQIDPEGMRTWTAIQLP